MKTLSGGRVLVVDDDRAVGMVLSGLLRQSGHEAVHVTSAVHALDALDDGVFDVVLTDLRMPGMDGMQLLAELRRRVPQVPVIMLTAHANVQNAVEAMKRGAADFLSKPFDRDEVLFTVDKALRKALHAAGKPERSAPALHPGGGESGAVPWLGDSDAMVETAALIARAAKTNSTVLIRGESGSGKEVAARAIHAASPRASGPFVPVHCGALPENLLESELFGYEKGAFTGAANRKPGRVEIAQGGTLFLDEIGDVSPAVQVKLLRLLQEREYQRLGGTEAITADVRFMAATHRDLEQMIESGEFREDLFYRLDVIPIWVAPLRERRADVAPLAKKFCETLGAANGRPEVRLDPAAVRMLEGLDWPGNVRELSNFVERLLVFTDGDVIGAAEVEREIARRPRRRAPSQAPKAGGETLETRREEAEHAAIREALVRASGNRTQAARLLGISRRTLYNKLAEMDGEG